MAWTSRSAQEGEVASKLCRHTCYTHCREFEPQSLGTPTRPAPEPPFSRGGPCCTRNAPVLYPRCTHSLVSVMYPCRFRVFVPMVPPLVKAAVNDQKLTEPMPSVAWTRVLLTRYSVHGTCGNTWCTIPKTKVQTMLHRPSCPNQLP